MIIQLSGKVWYILKIDIAAWLAAILLIYYIVHWSKRFMLDEMTLHQIYWGIAGSYDPDLPLNLGSKIRSRSQSKFGIGSDRNRSEVIEIDRDREKIVDLQCTARYALYITSTFPWNLEKQLYFQQLSWSMWICGFILRCKSHHVFFWRQIHVKYNTWKELLDIAGRWYLLKLPSNYIPTYTTKLEFYKVVLYFFCLLLFLFFEILVCYTTYLYGNH